MVSKPQAEMAKEAILGILNRPSWLRGVGITCAGPRLGARGWGEFNPATFLPCTNAVVVNVRDDEHVAIARDQIGDSVYGVPVVFKTVGDIVAQTTAGIDDEAMSRARHVKRIVRDMLSRPRWGGYDAVLGETWVHTGPSSPCEPAVHVTMQRSEHLRLATLLGDRLFGVPVVFDLLG